MKRALSLIVFVTMMFVGIVSCAINSTDQIKQEPKTLVFDGTDESAEDIANFMIDNKFFDEVTFDPNKKEMDFISDNETLRYYKSGTIILYTCENDSITLFFIRPDGSSVFIERKSNE